MNGDKYSHRYDDIINLPHPTSSKHPRMSACDRAAQFSPFAALTGHDAAIMETARLTEEQMELDEDTKEEINEKLKWIQEHLKEEPEVTITYFQPDDKKEGGKYVSHTGIVKRISDYEHSVIMRDGMAIQMEQMKGVSITLRLS